MERKHNASLTPLARQLRKQSTKEERHLWYDYLRAYPVRFLRQKSWGGTSSISIAPRQNW